MSLRILRPARRGLNGRVPIRTDTSLRPLDLALSGLSSIAALYAGAVSLSSTANAQFFSVLVILGTLASFLIVYFLGSTRFVQADGVAYTAVAVVSTLLAASLCTLLPENIYTGPLMPPAVLSWMIVLGSLCIWRDQTMLFQAVPSIALFGLVGCYDTFRDAVFYFFLFLMCQATLLARAHGRTMLQQAKSSGMDESLEIAAMRRGPWKWMAGPEWALGSALAVVLLSLVGAPFLRESARGISGLVRYVAPPINPPGPSVTASAPNGVRVGMGPNVVRDIPVMRVMIPEPRYLRSYIWGSYNAGEWRPRTFSSNAFPSQSQSPSGTPPVRLNIVMDSMKDARSIRFRIEPIQLQSMVVPAPGEVVEIDPDSSNYYSRTQNQSFALRSFERPPYPPLEGRSIIAAVNPDLRDTDPDIAKLVPDYLDKSGIPEDVAAFAAFVTKGAKTDIEKAEAIKSAIAQQVKYNLKAAPTPAGQDPVSHFLFKSKEGYCDLFASSMTLMARSVGLPARYVTGFYPFDPNTDGLGRFTIREKDAHAWCEVFFKNGGWVVFDATEGAEAVDGGGLGSDNARPFFLQAWFLLSAGLAAFGTTLYLGLKFIPGYLAYRRSSAYLERRARAVISRHRGAIGRQLATFEGQLRHVARRPRRAGETLAEYISVASTKLGAAGEAAWATGGMFEAALYARVDPEPGQIGDLKRQVREFARARRGARA